MGWMCGDVMRRRISVWTGWSVQACDAAAWERGEETWRDVWRYTYKIEIQGFDSIVNPVFLPGSPKWKGRISRLVPIPTPYATNNKKGLQVA